MVNQNEDIPGMSFLNLAFDSANFVRASNHLNSTKKQKATAVRETFISEEGQNVDSSSKKSNPFPSNLPINRTDTSKTNIYCKSLSRALDIPSCKVVPFFGSFLQDLRQILDNIPSRIITCNKNIQKPIEVYIL